MSFNNDGLSDVIRLRIRGEFFFLKWQWYDDNYSSWCTWKWWALDGDKE